METIASLGLLHLHISEKLVGLFAPSKETDLFLSLKAMLTYHWNRFQNHFATYLKISINSQKNSHGRKNVCIAQRILVV